MKKISPKSPLNIPSQLLVTDMSMLTWEGYADAHDRH